MEIEQLCAVLKQTTIGKELSEDELHRVVLAGTVSEVPKGTKLMEEGARSDSLLVLLEGEAEVLKGKETARHRLALCSQGSVLGEIGLLLSVPRTATVRAIRPCLVFSLQREAFEKLLSMGESASCKLSVELARILGNRLHNLTEEVACILEEQDRLHKAIASIKSASSKKNLMRQAEHLRENNLRLKQQLYHLNVKVKHNKIAHRGAQYTFGLAGGIFAIFVIGTYFVRSLDFSTLIPSLSRVENPAIIPFLTTEEKCKRRNGSDWNGKECLDRKLNPEGGGGF